MLLFETQRIWDRAPHCAFTDLVSFQGRLMCAFREASDHHSADGVVRVIVRDGGDWRSLAALSIAGEDLRDPKFVATPQGGLALLCAAVKIDGSAKHLRTLLFESADGEHWSEPRTLGDPDVWLWRLTWAPSGKAYGMGYCALRTPAFVRLYATGDLRSFEALVPTLHSDGRPSEHALAFLPDGRAVCLLRRDPGAGLVGVAREPYSQWEWKDLGARIGGPCLILTEDSRLIAAVRLYDGEVRTSLCELFPDEGRLEELLALPSGEDTSYPGMVLAERELFVSYYSSHEGQTAIYLARVRLGT